MIQMDTTPPKRLSLKDLDPSYVILSIRLDIAYFAKNWKHYNKIIFKYVNSIVRPIFNENFVEKRDL